MARMKSNRWGWQAPGFRWLDRLASLREEVEDLPPEEDPVGDYIFRREQQGGFPEDDPAWEPARTDPEPQPADEGSDAVSVVNLSADDANQVLRRAEAGEPCAVDPPGGMGEGEPAGFIEDREEAGVSAEDDPGSEYADPDLGAAGKLTDPQASDERSADAEPTPATGDIATAPDTQNPDFIRPYPLDEADIHVEEDDGTEALLEVFRNEKVNLNPMSALAESLADMNVYSLLEETIRVAATVRGMPVEDTPNWQELLAKNAPALPGQGGEEDAAALPGPRLQEEVRLFSEPRLEDAPMLPESHLEGEALALPEPLPEEGEAAEGT